MITQIKIKGYKSILELDLRLTSINILIGSNGVGKSNFVSVFSLIRNIYNRNLQNYIETKGGADSFLHFGKKSTEAIDIELTFSEDSNDTNRFIIRLAQAQDSLIVSSVETAYNSYGTWHNRIYETNKKESEFSQLHTGQAYWVNERLIEFNVYHFHDTGDKSPMKSKSNIDDNQSLKCDGSNIAAFLYFLKERHNKHYVRIEKTVQSIAPFFGGFVLSPSKLNESKIQLEWRDKNHPDMYFNAYNLSDGTLRFICLATLLMQPAPPKTIIIDEPELGLHPVAINKLAALIRKASDNTQIILSSQSVNLIDNFDPEDIIVTNSTSAGSDFKRLNPEELKDWLKDYTLGDLWGKNILGAQPYLI